MPRNSAGSRSSAWLPKLNSQLKRLSVSIKSNENKSIPSGCSVKLSRPKSSIRRHLASGSNRMRAWSCPEANTAGNPLYPHNIPTHTRRINQSIYIGRKECPRNNPEIICPSIADKDLFRWRCQDFLTLQKWLSYRRKWAMFYRFYSHRQLKFQSNGLFSWQNLLTSRSEFQTRCQRR